MRHIQNMKPGMIRKMRGMSMHTGKETFSNEYVNGGISYARKSI